MKNLKIFKNLEIKLFGEDRVKLIREPVDRSPYDIITEMLKNGETTRKIDKVGTICYIDGEIPQLLFVPDKVFECDRLVVEANNCESDDKEKFLRQACEPLKKFYYLLDHPVPVLVPLIPTAVGKPYYQQLSTDMYYEKDVLNVPEIVNDSIKKALDKIEEISGVRLDDKVFLNGYSSSGVFAQRFALLHPETVDTLCVGGASLSIPAPTTEIEYPLGFGNIPDFDFESYKKIKFRFYQGEFETTVPIVKKDVEGNGYCDRKDVIDGQVVTVEAPMHDMTYFPRSVSPYTGKKYRDALGIDLFTRNTNITNMYLHDGYDFRSTIIRGRAHRNYNIDGKVYKGVNETADPIIDSAYLGSIVKLRERTR